MKKTSIFIVFLLVFSLYGCGKTQSPASTDGNEVISQAIKLISNANSFEYTLVVEEATTYGINKVESYSKMNQKQIFEPFTIWTKSDTKNTRINGEKSRTVFESYQKAQNDQLDINFRYSNQEELSLVQGPVLSAWENNSTKVKEQIDLFSKMNRNNLEAQLYLLSSNIKSFKLAEDDGAKDKNILKYDGYIDPTTVLEAYQKYLRDNYAEMGLLVESENPSLEVLKTEITSGEVVELQSGIPKLAYSEESIPISLWINKDTFVLEKVVIDESSVLQSLLEKVAIEANPNIESPVVSKSLYTYEIKGIDTLKEIIRPE